mgnify:CR=1 FL=1
MLAAMNSSFGRCRPHQQSTAKKQSRRGRQKHCKWKRKHWSESRNVYLWKIFHFVLSLISKAAMMPFGSKLWVEGELNLRLLSLYHGQTFEKAINSKIIQSPKMNRDLKQWGRRRRRRRQRTIINTITTVGMHRAEHLHGVVAKIRTWKDLF